MIVERFEDLVCWQKAQVLASEIYINFKTSKDFSFVDQIKRASVSVSNNIAEGFERKSNKELINFLYIAKGSCGEVRSMLWLAKRLGYIDEIKTKDLIKKSEEVSKMISGFIKTL